MEFRPLDWVIYNLNFFSIIEYSALASIFNADAHGKGWSSSL